MQSSWTAEEKKLLEAKSRFVFEKPAHARITPLTAFLDPKTLSDFLQKEMHRIGSGNEKMAGSIFMKRYAFLAVGALASWSFFRKPFLFSPEDAWLIDEDGSGAWLPMFFIETSNLDEKQGQLKDALLHISNVIECVKQATRISSEILWENVAVYIFWLYETVAKEKQFASQYKRAKEDFQWLLAPEQSALFGTDVHPISKYFKAKEGTGEQENLVRIRSTCCLSYQLKTSGKKCSICPVKSN